MSLATEGRPAAAEPEDARAIAIERLIDAPRELVFEAFTEERHLARWWGPNGFSITTSAFDFRVGGVWRFVMHGPDGRDYQNQVAFEAIERPARIAWRHRGDGEEVGAVQFRGLVTLTEAAGRTHLTWRLVFPSVAERDRVVRDFGAEEGAVQTTQRLADYVAGRGAG